MAKFSPAAARQRRGLSVPRADFRLVEAVAGTLGAVAAPGQGLLVAVSGGGDSMALLELCCLVAPRLGMNLLVVYVDHGLRPEAAWEAAIVEARARHLGAPFESIAVSPEGDDEDSLRRARLGALEQLGRDRDCRWIALGHSADDQIETVLLRFLRGAALGGLAGMSPRRGPFLRPLLTLRREELRAFLRRRGLGWVEDASNGWPRYARVRLRRDVVPAIEAAFGGGVLAHLPAQAARWREDQDFLDAEALRLEAYCSRPGPGGQGRAGRPELDLHALSEAAPALRSRVLHRWLGRLGSLATPDLRHVAQVEALLLRPEALSAGLDLPGLRVWCEEGRLRSADASAPEGRVGPRRRVAASRRAC